MTLAGESVKERAARLEQICALKYQHLVPETPGKICQTGTPKVWYRRKTKYIIDMGIRDYYWMSLTLSSYTIISRVPDCGISGITQSKLIEKTTPSTVMSREASHGQIAVAHCSMNYY